MGGKNKRKESVDGEEGESYIPHSCRYYDIDSNDPDHGYQVHIGNHECQACKKEASRRQAHIWSDPDWNLREQDDYLQLIKNTHNLLPIQDIRVKKEYHSTGLEHHSCCDPADPANPIQFYTAHTKHGVTTLSVEGTHLDREEESALVWIAQNFDAMKITDSGQKGDSLPRCAVCGSTKHPSCLETGADPTASSSSRYLTALTTAANEKEDVPVVPKNDKYTVALRYSGRMARVTYQSSYANAKEQTLERKREKQDEKQVKNMIRKLGRERVKHVSTGGQGTLPNARGLIIKETDGSSELGGFRHGKWAAACPKGRKHLGWEECGFYHGKPTILPQ